MLVGAGVLSQWIIPNLPLLFEIVLWLFAGPVSRLTGSGNDGDKSDAEVEEENLGPILVLRVLRLLKL